MTATSSNKGQIIEALKKLQLAALELSNVIDETGYKFEGAPEYLQDTDDFAYDITSFVEDEVSELEKPQLLLVK
jgi:hypothetical protein